MNNISRLETEYTERECVGGMALGPWLSPQLRGAVEHALQSKGGGFRARLVMAIGEACGLQHERADAVSTGLEYFHLASLLIDDLPCMDDAQMRRGLPCTHRIFGDSTAILAALALINRAYFLVWKALEGMPTAVQYKVNMLLDECLGVAGVLNGQALDLNFATGDRSAAGIENIARAKTGTLLRLSMLLPAITGGASDAVQATLSRIARSWGCTYQLIDDFKDVEWGESASGKTALRDAELDRPNLALALGRERAVARLRRRLEETRRWITELEQDCPAIGTAVCAFQTQLEQAGAGFLAVCAA